MQILAWLEEGSKTSRRDTVTLICHKDSRLVETASPMCRHGTADERG